MLLAFLFAVMPAYAGPMAPPVSACASALGGCDYYTCQEALHQCGESGYYVEFGHRYCEIYLAASPSFTPMGQEFLSQVRQCLEEEIETHPESATCDQIRPFAFDSHAGCYVKTGFCGLPFLEKLHVFWLAFEDSGRPELQQVFEQLQRACGEPL